MTRTMKNTLIAATAGILAVTSSAMAETVETTYDPYAGYYGGYDAYGSMYGWENAYMWADYYTNITGAYFGAYDYTYDYMNPYAGYGYNSMYYYNPYYDSSYGYDPYAGYGYGYDYLGYSPYYYYYGE
ncbi:MAG: hypothetical protein VX527_11285 [Planctomycetota bacterium]|nr:hypothetical protein [Planctomycetota bacterium]